MLQHYQSSLGTKMLACCQLQPVEYVPTASAMLLSRILSVTWIPVIVRLNKAKAAHFEPITVQTFETISGAKCIMPPQRGTLDVWWVKHEHENNIMNLYQRRHQPASDWQKYKELIHNVSIFASQFYSHTLTFSGEIPPNIEKLLSDTVVFDEHLLDMSSFHDSLNEINASEKSYYPNDTESDGEFYYLNDTKSDEEEPNKSNDEQSNESDDESDIQFNVSLYRLYHPCCNSNDIETYFRNLKR